MSAIIPMFGFKFTYNKSVFRVMSLLQLLRSVRAPAERDYEVPSSCSDLDLVSLSWPWPCLYSTISALWICTNPSSVRTVRAAPASPCWGRSGCCGSWSWFASCRTSDGSCWSCWRRWITSPSSSPCSSSSYSSSGRTVALLSCVVSGCCRSLANETVPVFPARC